MNDRKDSEVIIKWSNNWMSNNAQALLSFRVCFLSLEEIVKFPDGCECATINRELLVFSAICKISLMLIITPALLPTVDSVITNQTIS